MMSPGDTLQTVSKTVVQENINMYAEASGDHNPIHLDPDFAASTYFGRIVAHGMFVLAYVSEMMSLDFGRNWLESGRLNVHFRAPVFPGDRVATFGQVLSVAEDAGRLRVKCSVGCRNQAGEEVINGEAWVTIPGENMEDMLK